MSKKFNLYVGKAGQLYAMSEFLMRGWNVAMPEVDTGDDIFVVEDKNETFYRVQVKTAQITVRKSSISVQFSLSLSQIIEYESSAYFVFVVRDTNYWRQILLIPQPKLVDFHRFNALGSVHGKNLVLYFSIQNDKITCSNQDFTPFLNNFSDFPIVEH